MKPILFAALIALAACSNPTSTTPTATFLAGVVTTLSTSEGLSQPTEVAIDGANLYVTNYINNRINKIVIATGVVTTLAGSTASGSADGTGTAASFNAPFGLASDGTNLYVADTSNNMIRKIVIATGVVTTLAGSTTSGSADGTGTAASFNGPAGVATDGTNLYVADTSNNMIRKIVVATGVVTIVAGSTTSGSADGVGAGASFSGPRDVATDGTNLYVADTNNNRIRKVVLATGVVTTLAGSTTGGSADGTGTAATFLAPYGVATDGANLYVADWANHMIRKIVVATGVVTTLAGSTTSGSADGTGTAARFDYPYGVAVTSSDPTRLFVADTYNNLIRMIR